MQKKQDECVPMIQSELDIKKVRKPRIKKLTKIQTNSLQELNNQIAELTCSLEVATSMRDIAQNKFDDQTTIIDGKNKTKPFKKSTKR